LQADYVFIPCVLFFVSSLSHAHPLIKGGIQKELAETVGKHGTTGTTATGGASTATGTAGGPVGTTSGQHNSSIGTGDNFGNDRNVHDSHGKDQPT
jgi:hypothetical protein